jgi:hypothetical protein
MGTLADFAKQSIRAKPAWLMALKVGFVEDVTWLNQ